MQVQTGKSKIALESAHKQRDKASEDHSVLLTEFKVYQREQDTNLEENLGETS